MSAAPLDVLRDVAARIARLLEALGDGEYDVAIFVAEDLEHDLHAWIAALEKERAA
jgi:hypothetical protein